MYQLYIGNKNYSSWSLRPWLLMRALAIPFEECLVPFAEHSSWAKFREFAPNGLVPCLHDGSAVIWDSLAITEFLAEATRAFGPRTPRLGLGPAAPRLRCIPVIRRCAIDAR